ncbi:hypothetical protein A2V56_02155 [Candidatus Woesebacteria bacterium RBG_19FT_COMBO_42_9]|uniref:DNA helicase UvrD n=1 Tax=Candidatus Woesebacteria bacterium RBG_16_42_24 TaxID=1802485 RepID=A0A1F7XLQ7_9BACT|nr:MAG: hypothetical protein A2V97_02975 [Candidatus Woesebacteria bacterium RBG_16_42_24]OGM16933.1 MAG: hypothetical protein A2V56_02155 [Candidatus Woesebacteria bacterium RBG_19FT_COMBO_42_9]OGM68392.1 MAG: hypothetical protein A2985_01085 [Candidatus Woesebacteria bacterium RIFCSPLOWO2_01_FULL_43_11]
MKVVADLEVHSKYARAVSSQMVIPTIAAWADKKGIDLVGTGDFTHPMWLRELTSLLEEAGEGVYKFRDSNFKTRFLLSTEISCIYTHLGRGRRIHILVYLPTFADVTKFNQNLTSMGANLFSDGRPIVGLTLSQIVETALAVNSKALVIPAHVWTPWFGFYGANGGYDSLSEAFGESEKFIPAIETGLSSDPAMNWRIGELTGKRIVSFSDAHSPAKLGREATVFDMPEISFEGVRKAVWGEEGANISYTIEFYPEEGKYHYTGHRNCKVVYSPNDARKLGTVCPVCGKNLTVGVMSRVEELGRQEPETESETDKFGVRWIKHKEGTKPPYIMMVPLLEILAEAVESGVSSQKVVNVYEQLVGTFGSEFGVLLATSVGEIEKLVGVRVAEGISKVRSGDIVIEPGYDGVFGKVKIWPSYAKGSEDKKDTIDQGTLF